MKEIYSQICRLCLQITCDLLPIYGEGSSDNLSVTIMACTIIKLSKDDGFPENVCISCIKRLHKAFEFKTLCENSDAFLHNYNDNVDVDRKVINSLTTPDSESVNLISSSKNNQNNQLIENFAKEITPQEIVETIICKEEISVNEEDIPDQFEIVFSYTDSQNEAYAETLKSSPTNDKSVTSNNEGKKQKMKNKPIRKRKEILENISPFICKICKKEFNTLTGQKNHERSHNFEKNTKCSICHKVFSHAGNMRRHALIHQGIKPHVCHLCGKKFSRSSTLKDHVDIHHARNLKEYSCTLCDYTSARRNALQVHMVVKHQSGTLSSAKPRFSKPKPRTCKICDKTLSSTAALNMHMKIHNNVREHLCRHCGRAFHHKAGLENHERIHTGEKPFICPHCPKRFSQQIGLRIHVRTHTGERPYQCKLCLKTFSQQTHLRTHSFTHSGERRYQCEVCNKRFALREGLRYHQMTHTGETPFKCVMCNRGFYIQYKLKVHMAKSHGIAMEIVKK